MVGGEWVMLATHGMHDDWFAVFVRWALLQFVLWRCEIFFP